MIEGLTAPSDERHAHPLPGRALRSRHWSAPATICSKSSTYQRRPVSGWRILLIRYLGLFPQIRPAQTSNIDECGDVLQLASLSRNDTVPRPGPTLTFTTVGRSSLGGSTQRSPLQLDPTSVAASTVTAVTVQSSVHC